MLRCSFVLQLMKCCQTQRRGKGMISLEMKAAMVKVSGQTSTLMSSSKDLTHISDIITNTITVITTTLAVAVFSTSMTCLLTLTMTYSADFTLVVTEAAQEAFILTLGTLEWMTSLRTICLATVSSTAGVQTNILITSIIITINNSISNTTSVHNSSITALITFTPSASLTTRVSLGMVEVNFYCFSVLWWRSQRLVL